MSQVRVKKVQYVYNFAFWFKWTFFFKVFILETNFKGQWVSGRRKRLQQIERWYRASRLPCWVSLCIFFLSVCYWRPGLPCPGNFFFLIYCLSLAFSFLMNIDKKIYRNISAKTYQYFHLSKNSLISTWIWMLFSSNVLGSWSCGLKLV